MKLTLLHPLLPTRDVLQAFVDEMVDIAKAEWLKEYYTSDKKGLIAKVRAAYTFDQVSEAVFYCFFYGLALYWMVFAKSTVVYSNVSWFVD